MMGALPQGVRNLMHVAGIGIERDIAAGELVFDSFHIVTPGDWLKVEED